MIICHSESRLHRDEESDFRFFVILTWVGAPQDDNDCGFVASELVSDGLSPWTKPGATSKNESYKGKDSTSHN